MVAQKVSPRMIRYSYLCIWEYRFKWLVKWSGEMDKGSVVVNAELDNV